MIENLICLLLLLLGSAVSDDIKPHIVFIVADDLGWDDVSFHGSDQILTPNIDILAYEGVILQQYYTDPHGTAARSALFTGKYPLRTGTQSASIRPAEDFGIPAAERLLPTYLRGLGYRTHLIGKWHLGRSRPHYLPTYRGFDTFYGFHGGAVDYFTYNLVENWNDTSFFGLDLFDDLEPVEEKTGHLTDILTDRAVQVIRDHNTSAPLYLHVAHAAPHAGGGMVSLQPPVDSITANNHIAHSARRLYAGLVTSLDKSVGQIIAALAETEMLQDTMIVFVSDNGAPTTGPSRNFGSNLPLRGIKSTPWEGATRSIGLVWHASMTSGTFQGIFHVTDWLPTLVTAAGGNVTGKIDGVNQWQALVDGNTSKRKDALITIDDINNWAAFRDGDFKMIVGDNVDKDKCKYQGLELRAVTREGPMYENVLLESEAYLVFKETLGMPLDVDAAFLKRNDSNLNLQVKPLLNNTSCIPTKAKGCLFNITADPLEANDLWDSSPEVVQHIALRLRTLWAELKPRRQDGPDQKADPSLNNYVWLPWVENDDNVTLPHISTPTFPLQVTMGEVKYLVDLNLNTFKDKMVETLQNMGQSFVKSVSGLFSV